jgi:hypothetical protein
MVNNVPVILCIRRPDDCADLQLGKIYRLIPDKSARKSKYLRVIDDSGESYLYPASCFTMIRLPYPVAKALGFVMV